MKKLFLCIAALIAIFLPLLNAIPTQHVFADDRRPSGDGRAHAEIVLDGTNSPDQYTVSGKFGGKSIGKFSRSGSKFLSAGLSPAESCPNNTIKQQNEVDYSINVGSKLIDSGSMDMCGSVGFIQSRTVTVKDPSQAVSPASFSGQKVQYKDSNGDLKPFKSSATGTLKGVDNNQTYNLQFDNSGNIKTVSPVAPGKYKVRLNYVPPGDANQNYTTDLTLSAGQAYVLKGAIAGNATNPGNGQDPNSSDPASTTATTNDKTLGCDINANALSWIICPIVDALTAFIGFIDNIITQQLSVDTSSIFCDNTSSGNDVKTCGDYYTAWQSFRNIALGLMVIAGLVVVISQALGIEILDAYTLRKTVPRILIAALGITLSWPLMKFFVILTNDLGVGVRHLIYAPFSNISDTIHFGDSAADIFFGGASVAGGAAAGAGALIFTLGGGLGALLAYLGTAALAVLIAIVVLAMRQIAVILLMILAPVAVVCYILPNTQKLYKLWWDSFSKALLMFPLIAAFIASGRVFSAIAISRPGALNQFIGFIAYFAPYFLIPLTFKFAGGAVRQLGGFVNDRGKGGFDRLRNFRGARRKAGWERMQSGNLYKGARPGSRRERLNAGWQAASLSNPDEFGINPLRWRETSRTLRERRRLKGGVEGIENNEAFAPIKGDDDAAHAILSGDARRYLTNQFDEKTGKAKFSKDEIDRKVAHIEMARRQMGEKNLEQAAIMSAVTASTGYSKGGIGELLSDIDKVAGDDAQMRAQLVGQVKQRAQSSGRTDLAAPFSEMYGASVAIGKADDRQKAIQEQTDFLHDKIIDVEGAGFILGGKGKAVDNFRPALQRRLRKTMQRVEADNAELNAARASGDPQRIEDAEKAQAQTQRDIRQELAATAGLLDVAGQVSPEKAKIIADGVMHEGISVNGQTVTVAQAIEALRSDQQFQEMRREYSQATQAQYATSQAQAAQAAQQRGALPPTPPSPSPSGP